jgi:hypothetical protein
VSQDLAFTVCTSLATAGWLALLAAPRRPLVLALTGLVLPAVLAVAYVTALALSLQQRVAGSGFGSLDAVALLFQNRWALLAGWIHYLAFDLFVGTWIVRDAMDRRARRAVLLPILLVTFLFGTAGLLVYLSLRQRVTGA